MIVGQGTIGLEILDQLAVFEIGLDQLLVPCGGGGLVAGIAAGVKSRGVEAAVYSVEPQDFDDTARSLEIGRRVANRPRARSICDALLAPTRSALTYPINSRLLAGRLVVSDAEVRFAIRWAFRRLKLVIEPGGAVALAAALTGKVVLAERNTVVVVWGSNVDPEVYGQIMLEGPTH